MWDQLSVEAIELVHGDNTQQLAGPWGKIRQQEVR